MKKLKEKLRTGLFLPKQNNKQDYGNYRKGNKDDLIGGHKLSLFSVSGSVNSNQKKYDSNNCYDNIKIGQGVVELLGIHFNPPKYTLVSQNTKADIRPTVAKTALISPVTNGPTNNPANNTWPISRVIAERALNWLLLIRAIVLELTQLHYFVKVAFAPATLATAPAASEANTWYYWVVE